MNYILHFIYEYGVLAMFFLILLEYACFPVSSEIVLPFSGAIASIQHISFFLIIPISIIAGLIGTCLCYFAGRYGGVPLINGIQRKFPKSQKGFEHSFSKFNQYGPFAVCIARVIPICRTYIAFIAGAAKQPFLIFIGSSTIGITVWNILLIGLGYVLRENWKLVGLYYAKYKPFFLLVLFLIILLLLWKFTPLKRLFRQKNNLMK